MSDQLIEAAAEITLLRAEVARLQPSTLKIDHLRKQLDRAESEIGALRSLLAEARSGLGALVELHDAWREEPGNQADAYYMIAKRHGTWDLARALIARIGEVSDGKE